MKGEFKVTIDDIPENLDVRGISVKVPSRNGKELTIEYEVEPQVILGVEIYERSIYKIVPNNENYYWYIEILVIRNKKIYCNLCISVRVLDNIISFIELKPGYWGEIKEVFDIFPCSEEEIDVINYIRVNYPVNAGNECEYEVKWSNIKFSELLEKVKKKNI